MPELPEVETVRRGLETHVEGFSIQKVEIFDKRSLKRNLGSQKAFSRELEGLRLGSFERRGKFLWIPLSGSRCLVTHLGMSGQVLVRNQDSPVDRCERIRLIVSRGNKTLEVRFVDQRLFGGMYLDDLVADAYGRKIPASITHIALDPLESTFDFDQVVEALSKRSAGIKSLLLNQGILSGIGNIYADETLWLTKTHYLTPSSEISKQKLRGLIETAKTVLLEAVELGGTSFDEQYKNVNGESGYFSQSLNAYGQTGLPCPRCKTPIRREAWSNRGSHFCPRCQRPKR
jgi:formamidopyrimidine-DNA glycosylase